MNIDKYQEFADYLRRIVEGERDQCVIDKNLLLTAAAAIDELSSRILNAHPGFQINKVTMMPCSSRTRTHKPLTRNRLD